MHNIFYFKICTCFALINDVVRAQVDGDSTQVFIELKYELSLRYIL